MFSTSRVFLVFLSSSAPETHSVTDNWTGPSSSTSGMFPRSSLFFLFKIHSLLKYILGNTFWEIHFEKHIVRVHCAEIQHCYLREAKTFEQITLGKKHLARNVWRLRMCFTICLAWCESNLGLGLSRAGSPRGGLKTQQKQSLRAVVLFWNTFIVFTLYIINVRARLGSWFLIDEEINQKPTSGWRLCSQTPSQCCRAGVTNAPGLPGWLRLICHPTMLTICFQSADLGQGGVIYEHRLQWATIFVFFVFFLKKDIFR